MGIYFNAFSSPNELIKTVIFLTILYFLGPPAFGGRYASGLAGLLGPASLRSLVCGFAAPFRIARPNGSPALWPSFDKNFRLVKAFFKGIAMAEKNKAE
ncbi:hypothetical protein [Saprospira grandis]|uniref:hypothetical protein n=1 Tax=Saprospira grandis TaxID=1008 RepID=UPI0012DC539E|nr:hypothetical protein [Saprospira grandis]